MRKPALTTKSEVLLERHADYHPYTVTFRQYDDEFPTEIKYEYKMDVISWENMGKPYFITVTVQPGDLLNTETS